MEGKQLPDQMLSNGPGSLEPFRLQKAPLSFASQAWKPLSRLTKALIFIP